MRPNYLTLLHRRIARESLECRQRGQRWDPAEYPALHGLLRAAVSEIKRRRRPGGRMVMAYRRKRYTIRVTTLGRLKVHDWRTDEPIVSSSFWAA